MSDPRKCFICPARKHMISDESRQDGKESKCFLCYMEEMKTGIQTKNIVGYWEPK